jgi:hypothetical protein
MRGTDEMAGRVGGLRDRLGDAEAAAAPKIEAEKKILPRPGRAAGGGRMSLYVLPARRKRRSPEQEIQRQIAQFLDAALGRAAWYTTIPLGGGGRTRGAILKSIGTKEGTPDMIVIDAGRAIWLEIKSYTGAVSVVQKKCHADLQRARSPVFVVRSLDDAIAALRQCGVPMKISDAGAA